MASGQQSPSSHQPLAERVRQRIGRLPLAGRAPELEAIQESINATFSENRPTVVMLVGEAGIGKTRLAVRDVARARAQSLRCLPRIARYPLF
ncbi:hypothetical protein BH20CHL3_BH20CHL3_04090 [soil metagenome]